MICHSIFLGVAIKIFQEVHGIAALLGVLVEPNVVPNGDPLVMKFPLPLAAQLLQGFSTGAKK